MTSTSGGKSTPTSFILKVRDPADLTEWLDRDVYPALYNRLPQAFPDFGWEESGDRHIATSWPAGFVPEAEGKRPDRIYCYRDAPHMAYVHGRRHVRWLDWLAGCERPRGKAFEGTVAELCRLAGVPNQVRQQTAEQREAEESRQRRRDFLRDLYLAAQRRLWLPEARHVVDFANGRGLSDEDVRRLGLGYLGPAQGDGYRRAFDRVVADLCEAGWEGKAAREMLAPARKMFGYLAIPWHDELGRPLTLYGRWPGGDLPCRGDLPGWSNGDAGKGVPVPKTFALPGSGSKGVPLFIDRAKKAGCRELDLVEGLFDVLVLQARGRANAVGTVGGRLSREQVQAVKQFGAERVNVVGDPDGGGDAGTAGNVVALAAAGVSAYVPERLPDGMDPDEFVNAHGLPAWEARLRKAPHGLRHLARLAFAGLVAELGERLDGDDFWTEKLIKKAAAEVRRLPSGPEVRAYFLDELSKLSGVPVDDLAGVGTSAPATDPPRAEGPAGEEKAEGAEAQPGWKWAPIDSRTFFTTDYRPEWLVDWMLVVNEPLVIGGPTKSLKTSVAVDLAVSVASGTAFLGKWPVRGRRRVAVLTGESAGWQVQDVGRRVCAGRGLDPEGLDVKWQLDLPRLSAGADVLELTEGVRASGVGLLIVDPLYLCLLSGADEGDATNMYKMGPLFAQLSRACLGAGATPIFVHHTNRPGAMKRDPLELHDLAYAAIDQFASQWFLVNRREPFQRGEDDRLWLNAGGRAGQGGTFAVDVAQGVQTLDFAGRVWTPAVHDAAEVRESIKGEAERRKKKAAADKMVEQEQKFLTAMDALDPEGAGVSLRRVRAESGLSGEVAAAAMSRLEHQKRIEVVEGFKTKGGNNSKQDATGVRRVR